MLAILLTRSMQLFVNTCTKWKSFLAFLLVTEFLVDAGSIAMSEHSPLCRYVCRCDLKTRSVNCTHSELLVVPAAIPVDIKELSLANNKIQKIMSSDFSGLNQVTKLILSSNEIMFIEQGAFKDMYRLQYLNLNKNYLIVIPSRIFQHLPSLEKIELQSNSIKEIKKDAFLFIPNLKEIRMENNPLECNCELKDFVDFMLREKDVYFGGNCNQIEVPLVGVSPIVFGRCRSDGIFATNLDCTTCIDKKCHTERHNHCSGHEPVCMYRVTMNGFTLQSEKSCSTYRNCLEAESKNVDTCQGWNNGTSCVSCCIHNLCNKYDFAGWTHTFNLQLKFTTDKIFSGNFLFSRSNDFRNFSNEVKLLLETELLNQNGTFSVIFQDFRIPQVTVNMRIICTVPIHIDELQVWHNILDILKTSRKLEQLDIDPSTISLTGKMLCIAETTEQDDKGDFHWPTAKVGMNVELPCLANKQKATRRCIMNRRKRRLELDSEESTEESIASNSAMWAEPDTSQCLSDDWITRELHDLDLEDVDDDTIERQTARLLNISENAIFFKQIDVELSVQILQRIMPHISNLSTQLTTEHVFPILNNMINSPEKSLIQAEEAKFSANQLLEILDDISEEMKFEESEVSMSYSNLDVGIVRTNPGNFQGATFSMNTEKHNGDMKQMMVRSKHSPIDNEGDHVSISLPKTLFDKVPFKESSDITRIRITFLLFKQDKLFTAIAKAAQKNKDSKSIASFGGKNNNRVVQRINSQVLAATVPRIHLFDLKDPITMRFLHLSTNATKPQCVFWQDSSPAVPHWSTEGCSVYYNIPGKLTVCQCLHLTSFALLMDIYNHGDQVDPRHSKALSMLSFIGCGISFVALLITIFTYLGFRKLRSGAVSHILVSLCLTLAASNLIFVVGMQPYTVTEIVACKIVAVLLHYTLLASMMWMAIEAVHIYLAMVVVFRTYLSHFIIRCSLFAWGLPLGIVALTLGINKTENYILKGKICWLSQSAFYTSFLFPISAILLFNVSIFCIIVWRLLAMQKIKKYEHNRKKIRLIGIVGVFFLLGLTWTMAFLAVGEAGLIFTYLFTIFNSLQGLFIFIFYCLYKKESRDNLIQLFQCWPKSEKLERFDKKFSAKVKLSKKSKDVRSRKPYDSESNVNSTENSNAGFTDDNNVITKL